MELIVLACCALSFVAVFAVGTLATTVSLARRVGAEQHRIAEQLPELGLAPVPGSAWHEGEIGGRRVAVRANRGVGLGAAGVRLDTSQFSQVDLLVALDIPPVGGRISDAARRRRDATFDTVFFAELGGDLAAVSEPSRRALVAWAHETDEPLLLVDRTHRTCSAGPALTAATVLLCTSRRGPLEVEQLRAWIEGVVVRASGLR